MCFREGRPGTNCNKPAYPGRQTGSKGLHKAACIYNSVVYAPRRSEGAGRNSIREPGSPVEGKDGSSKETNTTLLSSAGHSLGRERHWGLQRDR